MSLTTPALLFPAISLLFLAYTTRFQVLALLIRQLCEKEVQSHSDAYLRQMSLLSKRIHYIQLMQGFAVVSFMMCTFSMFCLFVEYGRTGMWLFGGSLIALAVSLLFALVEVILSSNAIAIELEGLAARGSAGAAPAATRCQP